MQEIAIYTQAQPLTVKEYRGQRVITFKDVDTLHQRPEGTAHRNFKANRSRFIEGEDFFLVKPTDFQKDEFRPFEVANRGTVLLTKMGYLLLVKSFTDDLAWHIQRQLIKGYFEAQKARQALPPAQGMAELVEAIVDRLGALQGAHSKQKEPEYSMSELQTRKRLSRKEAACYLGVCEATLHKIIHAPDFPALIRLGNGRGRVFINREKLDAYLEGRC